MRGDRVVKASETQQVQTALNEPYLILLLILKTCSDEWLKMEVSHFFLKNRNTLKEVYKVVGRR